MAEHKLNKKKKKLEYSKLMMTQESVLIWVLTLSVIVLAYICVFLRMDAQWPWLVALVGLPWSAYGVSQSYYYKKAKSENTKGGIKYDSTMAELLRTNDAVYGDADIHEDASSV